MDLNTYLFFDGQCRAAFELYERVLGGKIVAMLRYADAPAGVPMPSEDPERIMHARMELNGRTLMGSDAPPGHARDRQGFRVQLAVREPAEAERIFHALADGGKVAMPMGETFFANRFGMVDDCFGIPWMVMCEKPADTSRAIA